MGRKDAKFCAVCGLDKNDRINISRLSSGLVILLCVMITLAPAISRAQGNLGSNSSPVVNRQGIPLAGVKIAVCQPLATTAASVSSNVVTFTMATNPVTAGFAPNMSLLVSGFTGADTYFNAGTLTNGAIVGGYTILSVTPTTVTSTLVHANASASTNGTALQEGNGVTSCAGLSSIFQDPLLSIPSTNPTSSDQLGNWNVFATSGVYYVQFYSPSIVTTLKIISAPLISLNGIPGLGSVTSVGLAAPHEIVVSGSPVTSAGTLTEAWSSEPYNTVFGGPTQNSIAGTFDGFTTATSSGTSTTLPITITPANAHDLAIFIAQADPGVAPVVSVTGGPGSWTSLINAGGGIAATQLLTTNSPLTATATFGSAVNSTGMITVFKAVGTPVVAQFANASGSVSNGATSTFPGNTTPGNSLLVVLLGGSTAGNVQAVITDSQGNTFTPITNVQTTLATGGSFTQTIAATFLASNLKGTTHDVVTFNTLFGLGFSGEFNVYEIAGLSPFQPIPTFRPLSNGDLIGTAAALVGSSPLVVGFCVQGVAGPNGTVQLVSASGPCGTSSGTLTATGSPVAGNLAKFSGATSLTNGDLSGDCTTAGALTITCTKINGATVPIFRTGSVAGCSTGGSSYSGCASTITWTGGAFADTSYFATCTGVSPSGFPYIEGITSQTAGAIVVETRNGTSNGSVVSSYGTINCVGVHP